MKSQVEKFERRSPPSTRDIVRNLLATFDHDRKINVTAPAYITGSPGTEMSVFLCHLVYAILQNDPNAWIVYQSRSRHRRAGGRIRECVLVQKSLIDSEDVWRDVEPD
jgi:hypothetical protein